LLADNTTDNHLYDMKRQLEPDDADKKKIVSTANIAEQTTNGSPQFSEWLWIYLIDKGVGVF
jgi:hypothetical protein